jgi:hypothetical protein
MQQYNETSFFQIQNMKTENMGKKKENILFAILKHEDEK